MGAGIQIPPHSYRVLAAHGPTPKFLEKAALPRGFNPSKRRGVGLEARMFSLLGIQAFSPIEGLHALRIEILAAFGSLGSHTDSRGSFDQL